MTFAVFHDFPGLENGPLKFHDFPGPVGTLIDKVQASHSPVSIRFLDFSN